MNHTPEWRAAEQAYQNILEAWSHPASVPNPCAENGCTDTENCDEICQHQRIYSLAWLKDHDAAIRNEERNILMKSLQKHIDDPDSREGCEFGVTSIAKIVNWMQKWGYDCD